MSIIFVQVNEPNIVAKDFFKGVHKRLQSDDLSKNMFRGKVKNIRPGLYAVEMRAVWLFNLPTWLLRYLMKKGLRRAGEVGEVKFLSRKIAIVRLLDWDK